MPVDIDSQRKEKYQKKHERCPENQSGSWPFSVPKLPPFRVQLYSGNCRTIIIDAGKNFQAAAVEWFPKYGLRKIDALLLTHAHADGTSILCFLSMSNWQAYSAMNGLDDLRGTIVLGCASLSQSRSRRLDAKGCNSAAYKRLFVAGNVCGSTKIVSVPSIEAIRFGRRRCWYPCLSWELIATVIAGTRI